MQSLPSTAASNNAPAHQNDELEIIALFKDLISRVNALYRLAGVKEIVLESSELDPRKDALAYFIDANKTLEPEWKGHIQLLAKEIDKACEEKEKEAALEMSWRLTEAIDLLYLTHLHKAIQDAKNDPEKAEKLENRTTRYKQIIELNKLVHSSGKFVSFGGIPRDLLPKWYITNFKQPS